MVTFKTFDSIDFQSIEIDPFWNIGDERELKIHGIHAYPAKFPSFITTKALSYVMKKTDMAPKSIGDVFCGCGTTAVEAKRNGIPFWGCDINPVATLIAATKSKDYDLHVLDAMYEAILDQYQNIESVSKYAEANERLQYWYSAEHYDELQKLTMSIERVTKENSEYRDFFNCAFSNILKPTSMWLTKSIKPQFDPKKQPIDVMTAFSKQYKKMRVAVQELPDQPKVEAEFITDNFLNPGLIPPTVDLVVTSPPYVTSYEYADLHQLSSLWLGYADDYRQLRQGSIGSSFHEYYATGLFAQLNDVGFSIATQLYTKSKSQAHAVAVYFRDMQQVAEKVYRMLNPNGHALFVIGNTEYKGVRIDNAKHLGTSLLEAGFSSVDVTKRKISNKILTPYRDKDGKFSTDKVGRKVYAEEFILIGRK